ncbi:MAG: thioredoxin domain-containing protein, partial [Saccharolobus sp.]
RKVLLRGRDIRDLSKFMKLPENEIISKINNIRAKLLDYREKTRAMPYRDENTYTYPNAKIAEALLYSSTVLNKGINEVKEVINKFTSKISRKLSGGKMD